MQVRLLAAGTRMPPWVTQGFEAFAERLKQDVQLMLIEVPLYKRGRNSDPETCRDRDGEKILARVRDEDWLVALDVEGQQLSTAGLARKLERWLAAGRPIALMIGGPDGLSPACLARANERWSLSDLTFPHGLARVIVAEALYRAWSLRSGHPYHRA